MADTLQKQLIRHEGLHLKPYVCPGGKLTIGVGRNLEDRGITESEALVMLNNDIIHCYNIANHEFPWFIGLSENRKNVILNMLFNLGLNGLRSFKRMLLAVAAADYEMAAIEMLDSKWAEQVGGRAVELSTIMREG